VYAVPAPSLDPAIYDLGVPVLGICYGAQLMALQLGGEVANTGIGEYGRTTLTREGPSLLMSEWPTSTTAWMSHGDAIASAPAGFVVTASSPEGPVAVMEDVERRLYATQFHPEVAHTERGQELLSNFLHHVAGIPPAWTNTSIIEEQVAAIRAQEGSLCALGRRGLRRGRGAGHESGRHPVDLRLRRHRTDAQERSGPDRRDLRSPVRR
jgi:GMP synthase (glutamine-hydrolysing)